jgi:transcriptional regulator with XRE-family HTH domain
VRQPPDQTLALLLKRLREDRGLTQEQLAFDTGLSASALSRIERGLNNPAWTTVVQIAKALDVTVTELAAQMESPPSSRQ